MLSTPSSVANAWPAPSHSRDIPLLSSLASQVSSGRAIENDYCVNPADVRPAESSPVADESHDDRQREHLLRNGEPRHYDGLSRSRNCRNHRDRISHRRYVPLPGSAARVLSAVASLPSHMTTREPPTANEPSKDCHKMANPHPLPPRAHPATVGHCPPRRCTSEDLSRPRSGQMPPVVPPRLQTSAFTSVPINSSTPPPRPPPSGPKLALQDNHSNLRTVITHRSPPGEPLPPSPDVVVAQPKPSTPLRIRNDSISKKSMVVELKEDKPATKLAAQSPKLNSTKSTTKTDSCSKKDTNHTTHSRSDDSHELMELSLSHNKPRPGEHKYKCPRCGKCMCPKCRGEIAGTREASRKNIIESCSCSSHCVYNVGACIEVATCFCCVKGCFYHCTNYDDGDPCIDQPCSCETTNWCCRWSVLAALSLVLPCLCCYPPARGCLRLCRACMSCMKPGCRCKESNR